MDKKRVLSGIRSSGRLHIGNYYGAVKGMLKLQEDNSYETLYMVADLHTLTTPYNVEELKVNRKEIVIDYLAAGINPEKSIIFFQSDVNEHTQLAFLFSTIMTISRMQHLPTYKEKVKQFPKENTMALLNYPILMAADILLYKASLVPVGIDQEPHLEVAREIAKKMNSIYKTDFPEPVRFKTEGDYIPSLSGHGKMSKTVEGSYINLIDNLDEIEKKISKIPTDEGIGKIEDIPEGVKALFLLIEIFEGKNKKIDVEKKYETTGIKYNDLKKSLAKAIFEELKSFQEKRNKLMKDEEYIKKVINDGALKARNIAVKTIEEVKSKMGFSL